MPVQQDDGALAALLELLGIVSGGEPQGGLQQQPELFGAKAGFSTDQGSPATPELVSGGTDFTGPQQASNPSFATTATPATQPVDAGSKSFGVSGGSLLSAGQALTSVLQARQARKEAERSRSESRREKGKDRALSRELQVAKDAAQLERLQASLASQAGIAASGNAAANQRNQQQLVQKAFAELIRVALEGGAGNSNALANIATLGQRGLT